MAIRTELEWSYQPTDYFEAPTAVPASHGQVSVDAGKATYTLASPSDSVPPSVREIAGEEIAAVFELRQMLTHKPYTIAGPTVIQHQPGGARSVAVSVGGVVALSGAGLVDVVVSDAAGNVLSDSRADRISTDTAFVSSLTPKLVQSATLRAMVRSFGQAVRDPADELVHLYEVRDAALKHFKTESKARAALGITKAAWQELGRLANDEPLRQGRHRGRQMTGMRDATHAELAAARAVARRIIEAFAATV
jgi:hypothetical protein